MENRAIRFFSMTALPMWSPPAAQAMTAMKAVSAEPTKASPVPQIEAAVTKSSCRGSLEGRRRRGDCSV
jgi:hypothetical protein